MKQSTVNFCDFLDAGALLPRRDKCTYWERISHVFALVILVLFPLTMGFDGYYDITQSKYVIFKWTTILYLIACGMVLAGLYLERPLLKLRRAGGRQKLTLPQILLIAFLLWSTLSAIVSPYPFVESWQGQGRSDGLCGMLLYGAVFLLLSFWGEYSERFPVALGAMSLVLGAMMLMQSFGSRILYPPDMNFFTTRFLGTIGNIDCVAGIVSVVAPALACRFILLDTRWRWLCLPRYVILWYIQLVINVDTGKVGLLAAFFVVLPFLFTTRRHIAGTSAVAALTAIVYALHRAIPVRGNLDTVTISPPTFDKIATVFLVSGLVLCALSALLYLRDKKCADRPLPIKPSLIRWAVLLCELLALVVALVALYRYTGDNRLLTEISQVLHGHLSDTAGTGRGIVWKNCLTLIKETPIIGSGPGTFSARHEPYNDRLFFDAAHNDFLQIGVCQGLVGLGLYVAFLVSLALRALRAAPRCLPIVIFVGACAGYLVYTFFVFSIAIVSPLFWVLAGVLDKTVRQVDDAQNHTPTPRKQKKV